MAAFVALLERYVSACSEVRVYLMQTTNLVVVVVVLAGLASHASVYISRSSSCAARQSGVPALGSL